MNVNPRDNGETTAGQLPNLVEAFRSAGSPAVLSHDQTQAWVPLAQGQLQRIPLECPQAPDKADISAVLAQKSIWIAGWLQEPTAELPANCFDYACDDGEYCVEKLSKYGRRDVRRGLRSFEVRRCTWDELVDKGFSAYADAEARHGHTAPSPDELRQMAAAQRDCPLIELWGAWDGEDLAAWIKVMKVDDWAFITTACSCNEALRNCPNNAVTYEATRALLVAEGRRRVSYGISSLQATDNILSLHKFKLRMGYEALRRRRAFAVHPLLRPLVANRPASWMWDLLVRLRPGSGKFSKVAGMARMLTGRAGDPLAWAEDS